MAQQKDFVVNCPCKKEKGMLYMLIVEEADGTHIIQKECLKCSMHNQKPQWINIPSQGWKEPDDLALLASN